MCLCVGYPEQPTQAELEADIDAELQAMMFTYVFVYRLPRAFYSDDLLRMYVCIGLPRDVYSDDVYV